MNFRGVCIFFLIALSAHIGYTQVDTTYIYDPSTPFGVLDLRLSKSSQQHYYLKEGQTFSFREANGNRTHTYLDMTAWNSEPYTEGNLRERDGERDSFVMNYRLLKPLNYHDAFADGYPLVIVLHGLLERGNCAENKCYHASGNYSPGTNVPPASTAADHPLLNNDYSLVHGGSNYLEAGVLNGNRLPNDPNLPPRGFPGFVVFPQNLNGWDDLAVEDAIRIVRLLTRKYNIDEDRIYINGVSHGGHGTYKAITRAPWLFAAAVLFSAADDAGIIAGGLSSRIVGIPLWLFQGGKDVKPTPTQTERYVKHFRSKGSSVRFTLYPDLGHGTWNKAFAEPDFFSWMLRQRKNDIHVYADNPVICSTSGDGVLLSLPEGYTAYEWEQDGTKIGSTAKITARSVGKYRARFMSQRNGVSTWSDWSEVVDVVTKDPGMAEMLIHGTRFLPDPNGRDSITLQAVGNYDIYNWYKENNNRLKVDETVKSITISTSMGDGKYFLKASGFDRCETRPSVPRHIYFANRAPVSIHSPTALQVRAISPSQTEVTWIDNSNDESGFEVWRRRKLPNGEFDDWKLATIAEANSSGAADRNLTPSSTYQYQIRAINETARSVYFPDHTQSSVVITTEYDNQKPSAPTLMQASQNGFERLSLAWKPSSDNSAVVGYKVILNQDTIATQTTDTTLLINKIEINTNYAIHVLAVDAANNLSPPSNEMNLYTAITGLFYQHTTGAWESLSEIDWTLAEFTGNVPGITLAPKTQQDFFNFRFDGFLRIVEEGIYQFRISSDDGSRLSLNDSVLVVNDGVHTLTTTTSPIQLLTPGAHRIQIDFFDYDRSDSLIVEYKGPDSGGQWLSIPDEAFTSDLVTDLEEDAHSEKFVSVYPNPTTNDNVNIDFSEKGAASISLRSSTGKLIQKTEFIPDGSVNVYRMPESNSLSPGLYFINIQQSNRSMNVRVIIK